MKKLLIFGSKGLLGKELQGIALATGRWKVFGSDRSNGGIDITKKDSVSEYLKKIIPDAVVNCAGYTDVDACEDSVNYKIALKVNSEAVTILGKACIKQSCDFLNISTDYVFGGNDKKGYKENYQKFKPVNKYGQTKYIGEQNMFKLANGLKGSSFELQEPRLYLVRTSWLFGPGAKNFVYKILELSKKKVFLEVVTDEVSSPTYVKDLAEGIMYLLEKRKEAGIYHITGQGNCSRFDFAKEIIKTMKINKEIRPIDSGEFKRKAKVPKISILLNTKLKGIRSWKNMLHDYLLNNLSD